MEIDLIVSSLRRNRKKVKEFQRGRTDINFKLDNDNSSSIIVDDDDNNCCSNVLIFDQKESDNEMIIRSFLCKRIDDNGNLKVLNDLYFSVIDKNLSS